MRSHRASRVSAASVLGVFLLGAVLTGCAPEPGTPAETNPPLPSSSATPGPTTDPEDEDDAPSILQIPEVTDKEIARALFSLPDDTPTSPNTVADAIVSGEPLILEGACIGESARYQITSAVPNDSADPAEGDDAAEGGDSADDTEAGEVLRTGILRCNEALYSELSLPVDGPVQISFVATDDIDEGWLVLTRTGEAE